MTPNRANALFLIGIVGTILTSFLILFLPWSALWIGAGDLWYSLPLVWQISLCVFGYVLFAFGVIWAFVKSAKPMRDTEDEAKFMRMIERDGVARFKSRIDNSHKRACAK